MLLSLEIESVNFGRQNYNLERKLSPNMEHKSGFRLVIFSIDSSSGLKCSFESVIEGCQQRRRAHLHELSTSWSALKILAAYHGNWQRSV